MEFLLEMLCRSGLTGWILVLLFMIALGGSVIGGVLLVLRRPVPPLVLTGALSMMPLVAMLGHFLGASWLFEAAAYTSPEVSLSFMAAGISQSVLNMLLACSLSIFPAFLGMLLCMVAGLRASSRSMTLPAVVLALVLVLVGAGVAAGFLCNDERSGMVHGVGYLLTGLMCAVALSGRDEHGVMAGATAAAILPLYVAAFEMQAIFSGYLNAFEAVAHSPANIKATLMEVGIQTADARRPASWVALIASSVIALLGTLSTPARTASATVAALVGVVTAMLSMAIMGPFLMHLLSLQFR